MVGRESRHDFNKEMDSYLNNKDSSDFTVVDNPKTKTEEIDEPSDHEESYEKGINNSQKSIFSRMIEFFGFRPADYNEEKEIDEMENVYEQEYTVLDQQEQELHEEEMEIERKKQGLITRFLRSLSNIVSSRKEHEDDDYEEVSSEDDTDEVVLHDMKTVGKIAVSLMKQLPSSKLKSFKESEDFISLKETLRKYGLIR